MKEKRNKPKPPNKKNKKESTTKLLRLSRPSLKAADVFIFSDTSGQVSIDVHDDGNSHSELKKKKRQAEKKSQINAA